VTPEDRLARLLVALAGLPRGARLLLPLLLFGLLIASLALAPSGGQPSSSSDRGRAQRSEPDLSMASGPARRFLQGYLAFSYGHGWVSRIRAADPRLLRALASQRVPPAARRRRPRIVALRVQESAPGVAEATAMIADGSGVRYPLVFYLERRSRGWLVTRLAD
jgi:hypothetical protein